jgi:hypothetical protein
MSKTPLEWIRLELLPLPGTTGREAKILWWNPEKRILEGEGHEEVLALAQAASEKGSLQTGTGSHVEINDPLHQPSELAAVLAQYYWVVPQPVAEPGQVAADESQKPLLN